MRPQCCFEICGLAQFIMVPVCHPSCCQVHKEFLCICYSHGQHLPAEIHGTGILGFDCFGQAGPLNEAGGQAKKPVWRAFVYLANSLKLFLHLVHLLQGCGSLAGLSSCSSSGVGVGAVISQRRYFSIGQRSKSDLANELVCSGAHEVSNRTKISSRCLLVFATLIIDARERLKQPVTSRRRSSPSDIVASVFKP